MFELIFGGFWTAITAFITFAFYGGLSGGTISVNGVPVSQAEFNSMLMPKIFFAIFWIIGLSFLFKGLKKLFANTATTISGKETYGYVVDIMDSNCYVNGRPVYNVKIAIIEQGGQFGEYIESSGMDYNKYPIGSYVKVKHHKKDINILGEAREYDVPLKLKNYIEEKYSTKIGMGTEIAGEDVIYIDGIKYVKASSKEEESNWNPDEKKDMKNDYFDV